MSRPARAIIDLEALRANYRLAQSLAPQANHVAVVKANAYGHDAVRCARALEPLAPAFGVACIEEALTLREGGIRKPILLLEGTFTADEVQVAAEQNFWLMVENQSQVDAVLASTPAQPLTVWLKLDTGMHRLGLPADQLPALHQLLRQSGKVQPEIVLATHLACADELDNPFTQEQITRFREVCRDLRAPASLANSPGLLGWPEARAEWNRPGFMLYGNSPFTVPHPEADRLQPVMRLQSAVIALRDVAVGESVGYGRTWQAQRPSRVATVAMGYGDGYPRHAANGTPVLINGRRAPLVGRVSMDMLTVDVTDMPEVALNDPVILWGPELPVNEVAAAAGTIGYELLTRMTGRVPRVFRD